MPTNNDRSQRLFGRDYIAGDEWIGETAYVPTLEEKVRMVREERESEQRIANYNQWQDFYNFHAPYGDED